MARPDRRRVLRAVPLALALGMLAVVVLAGLLPDTGVVSASSNCSYSKCPASTPFPLWAVSAAVAVVVIALILALLLLRRRRPPQAAAPPSGSEGESNAGEPNPAEPQDGMQDGSQHWDESQDQSSPVEESTGDGST